MKLDYQQLMKPVIVIPRGLMSVKDIAKLNSNDFCVVEAKDPSRVKFIDPIPSRSSRTEIEDAAIKLSRVMLNGSWRQWWNDDSVSASGAAHIFVKLLMEGTPLDSRGTKDEQLAKAYDSEKFDEIRRIAREDARAESKAKKEAAAKATQTTPTHQ